MNLESGVCFNVRVCCLASVIRNHVSMLGFVVPLVGSGFMLQC